MEGLYPSGYVLNDSILTLLVAIVRIGSITTATNGSKSNVIPPFQLIGKNLQIFDAVFVWKHRFRTTSTHNQDENGTNPQRVPIGQHFVDLDDNVSHAA